MDKVLIVKNVLYKFKNDVSLNDKGGVNVRVCFDDFLYDFTIKAYVFKNNDTEEIEDKIKRVCFIKINDYLDSQIQHCLDETDKYDSFINNINDMQEEHVQYYYDKNSKESHFLEALKSDFKTLKNSFWDDMGTFNSLIDKVRKYLS